MTTTTWHDANGFPHELDEPVNFTLEESGSWYCKACDTDVDSDTDDRGHEFDGDTAVQIWVAGPIGTDEEPEPEGDVFTGTFEDALRHFTETFSA